MSTYEEIDEEIAAIEAIVINGLKVDRRSNDGRPILVTYPCSPLVASEEDRSYVGLTLLVHITSDYPEGVPKIEIRNPRGLDELDVKLLIENLDETCSQYTGSPVIFQLIDLCQEFLTERNVPACPCVICLHHIVGDDDFTKTCCYHYFHSACFGRYVQSNLDEPKEGTDSGEENSLLCPMCRGALPPVSSTELKKLLSSRAPVLESESENFRLTKELKDLQDEMKKMFVKQQMSGGIIDVEAESKKFLIVTTPTGEDVDGSNRPAPQAAARIEAAAKPSQPAQEQPKRHKGGSGLGRRRDYGEKKRTTRRRT